MTASECAPCRRQGHYCPAVVYSSGAEGQEDEPMCLECADGLPCGARRVAGQGRDESSVKVTLGMFGELVFAGSENSAVIHRAPAELGIASVVPDIREHKAVSLDWTPGASSRGSMRLKAVKRDTRPAMRTIFAERPPEASVEVNVEVKTEVNVEVKNEDIMTDKRKKTDGVKCARQECDRLAFDGRKFCTYRHAYMNGAPKDAPSAKRGKAQSITIEPGQNGTAASLLGALEKVDAHKSIGTDETFRIGLELTRAEVDGILARLTGAQKNAFFAAGLRAALLAQ